MEGVSGARFLMDSWIMAGLLAVASITTTLGAAGVIVDDKAKGIAKDFRCAPLKRGSIVGGYLLATVVVGTVLSAAGFVAAEIYIFANGGKLLTFGAALKALGLIVLSCLASGAMVSFVVSFLKTPNALAVASTIFGTLSGFLMGIYVPVSVLPGTVQTAVKAFPISHAAVLLRQVLMEVALAGNICRRSSGSGRPFPGRPGRCVHLWRWCFQCGGKCGRAHGHHGGLLRFGRMAHVEGMNSGGTVIGGLRSCKGHSLGGRRDPRSETALGRICGSKGKH